MPKKEPGKPETEQVLDDESKNIEVVKDEEQPEKTVEVSTEDANQKPEWVSKEEFEKQVKRNEYQSRKLDKLLKQMEKITTPQVQPQVQYPKQPIEVPDDIEKLTNEQIETIALNDWQKAVDIRAELKYRKLLRDQEAKRQAEEREKQTLSELEQSKARVREKYPDIEDETSEISKMYIQVLNQDPSLLRNTRGPEIAMYNMEELMRKSGKQPPHVREFIDKATESELRRRERTGLGGLPAGVTPSGNKVQMTESEISLADSNNIPRSEFAKMKKLSARDFKEGVTVDE